MGILKVMLSCLDFILCIEEVIGKVLLDWFLGVFFNRNVEDR